MDPELRGTVTRLLQEAHDGRSGAIDELAPVIYAELKQIAAAQMRNERNGHTLQPTALAHEAWLKLADPQQQGFDGRAHFFTAAARVIRNLLIDHARERAAHKRGGKWERISVRAADSLPAEPAVDLLELNDSIGRLEQIDARQGRVVELRFFGGLSVEETAHVLCVSPATVKRDWEMARAWLYRELHP
jgi:RNA polymerase sigma factor (TIGR02999 family)